MASFFSSVRQGFGRQSNKNTNPNSSNSNLQQSLRGNASPSPTSLQPSNSSTSLGPSVSPVSSSSPGLPLAMSVDNMSPSESQTSLNRKPPYFFREEYSTLIVRGNFMTLAAKPQLVEEGEWLAHQLVEQYRLLDLMIQIIRTADEKTGLPICNPESCPTMSASGHTYTWLDNNKRPIKIPACQYIQLVQKWIIGKISDPNLFPTDTNPAPASFVMTPGADTSNAPGSTSLNTPSSALAGRDWLGKSSGFPENFEPDIKSIYRQMMRCYAHLYHGHWLNPFWHIGAYKELNTCFIHFVNVGKLFNLIGDKEMEPMQPLIDVWMAKGLLPNQQQLPNQKPDAASTPRTPSA